jgi:hypothetical protein
MWPVSRMKLLTAAFEGRASDDDDDGSTLVEMDAEPEACTPRWVSGTSRWTTKRQARRPASGPFVMRWPAAGKVGTSVVCGSGSAPRTAERATSEVSLVEDIGGAIQREFCSLGNTAHRSGHRARVWSFRLSVTLPPENAPGSYTYSASPRPRVPDESASSYPWEPLSMPSRKTGIFQALRLHHGQAPSRIEGLQLELDYGVGIQMSCVRC